MSAIEVVEGGDREHRARVEGVQPGEISEGVAFVLDIADAGELLVGRVGNLVMVAADGGHEAQLIVWRLIKDQRSECTEASAEVVLDGRQGRGHARTSSPRGLPS